MLDNVELISTLEETKQKATEVSEKLKLGAKTAQDIDKLRDGYRPAARRGAILFFVLADLSSINTMYQYSLSSYLEQFEHSLKKSMPDTILQKRLKNIMDTLTHNIYDYGCTGMSNIIYINPSLSEIELSKSVRQCISFDMIKYELHHEETGL